MRPASACSVHKRRPWLPVEARVSSAGWGEGLGAGGDPPPLKWSDLRYVFDIKEDCNGKEALQARRDRREAAPGGCSGLAGPGHDGGDPADRCERGDLLSLASRVWRAEDRAGQAPEGA